MKTHIFQWLSTDELTIIFSSALGELLMETICVSFYFSFRSKHNEEVTARVNQAVVDHMKNDQVDLPVIRSKILII